ncbi:hypothetical protein [Streptomyces sp. NBC_01276]|uniref:hypothetical protein n=1 Tax=Streptomyces sp. NBC_01276 TaxID=2903808 RepID=UPI002F913A1B
MINKTVRGMAVLAAAGVVWMGAASMSTSATTTTTTSAMSNTTVVSAADAPTEGSSSHREGAGRGHGCITTTAWGTGECPYTRLH